MVACLNNGLFKFFGPNLGTPVTDGQEVFKLEGVTLEGVDGAVMLAVFETVTHVDFNLVLTTIGLHHATILTTNKVLHG